MMKKESFAFLVGWSEWRLVWRSVWRSPPYFRPLIVFILLLSTYKLNVFLDIDKRFSSFLKWMEIHDVDIYQAEVKRMKLKTNFVQSLNLRNSVPPCASGPYKELPSQ